MFCINGNKRHSKYFKLNSQDFSSHLFLKIKEFVLRIFPSLKISMYICTASSAFPGNQRLGISFCIKYEFRSYFFGISSILRRIIFVRSPLGIIFFINKIKLNYLNHFSAFWLRWGHPGQQHGLFLPAFISVDNLWRCSCLVCSFFTIVSQQIHSFCARGVSFSQDSFSSFSFSSTSLKSSGNSCIKLFGEFCIYFQIERIYPAKRKIMRRDPIVTRIFLHHHFFLSPPQITLLTVIGTTNPSQSIKAFWIPEYWGIALMIQAIEIIIKKLAINSTRICFHIPFIISSCCFLLGVFSPQWISIQSFPKSGPCQKAPHAIDTMLSTIIAV